MKLSKLFKNNSKEIRNQKIRELFVWYAVEEKQLFNFDVDTEVGKHQNMSRNELELNLIIFFTNKKMKWTNQINQLLSQTYNREMIDDFEGKQTLEKSMLKEAYRDRIKHVTFHNHRKINILSKMINNILDGKVTYYDLDPKYREAI